MTALFPGDWRRVWTWHTLCNSILSKISISIWNTRTAQRCAVFWQSQGRQSSDRSIGRAWYGSFGISSRSSDEEWSHAKPKGRATGTQPRTILVSPKQLENLRKLRKVNISKSWKPITSGQQAPPWTCFSVLGALHCFTSYSSKENCSRLNSFESSQVHQRKMWLQTRWASLCYIIRWCC